MKKVLFLFLMCLPIVVCAQDEKKEERVVNMNRTFSVGGKALMCLRSANAGKNDLKALTWVLENNLIGEKNFITFNVDNAKTNRMEARQTWNDGEQVQMRIDEKGLKTYVVYDDTFIHLLLTEIGQDVYVIMLYSQLINEKNKTYLGK